MFGRDNYDILITKAALHGAKLLKKPHQATAVMLASHLWWQGKDAFTPVAGVDESEEKKVGHGVRASIFRLTSLYATSLVKMGSEYWNVSRNRCASLALASKWSLAFSYTVMLLIDTCITSNGM